MVDFQDQTRFDPFEKSIFWLGLVTAPLFWAILTTLAFLTFNWTWMVVAVMGAVMNFANLYGYIRCRWSSTDEFTNYFTKWAFFSVSFYALITIIRVLSLDALSFSKSTTNSPRTCFDCLKWRWKISLI